MPWLFSLLSSTYVCYTTHTQETAPKLPTGIVPVNLREDKQAELRITNCELRVLNIWACYIFKPARECIVILKPLQCVGLYSMLRFVCVLQGQVQFYGVECS